MRKRLSAVTRSSSGTRVWFQRIGALGSLLALLILGTSILLRLTTVFDAQGRTSSVLAPAFEQAARMLHRLCASGVAVLALCAVVLCWKQRQALAQVAKPTAWIVVSTLILALIGPLTPGYRLGAITVVNVSCGVLLLMSFWWLRESAAVDTAKLKPLDAFSWTAIVALLAHVGSGAAASAWEMQGLRWPAFVHLAGAVFCAILIGVVLLDQRRRPALTWPTFAVASLLAAQVLVGYLLMWQDNRSVGLSYFHAMLAPLLAAALVSLVKRDS